MQIAALQFSSIKTPTMLSFPFARFQTLPFMPREWNWEGDKDRKQSTQITFS
jgi:hypothetical protein